MSIEDIEMALETVKDPQGELVFPGLNIRGKLAPLAEHVQRSKDIFDEAANAHKHENGFQTLVYIHTQKFHPAFFEHLSRFSC